jgi:uncharacterized protein YjaZ
MDIDFQTHDHRDSKEKGVTLSTENNKLRVIIYLLHHETIEDIYATITHELIHYCIARYKMVDIDEYQEHDLIFKLAWIHEYVDIDDKEDKKV